MVFEPVSYADALEVCKMRIPPPLQAFIASLPESLEPEAVKQQLKMIGNNKLKPRDVFMPLPCFEQADAIELPSLISLERRKASNRCSTAWRCWPVNRAGLKLT